MELGLGVVFSILSLFSNDGVFDDRISVSVLQWKSYVGA